MSEERCEHPLVMPIYSVVLIMELRRLRLATPMSGFEMLAESSSPPGTVSLDPMLATLVICVTYRCKNGSRVGGTFPPAYSITARWNSRTAGSVGPISRHSPETRKRRAKARRKFLAVAG